MPPSFSPIPPICFTILAGVLGLCVGSFLNVVIYRLPLIMEREWRAECQNYFKDYLKPEAFKPIPPLSLSFPRSFCPLCNHNIAWFENIPVLSFLFLQGKCRGCKAKISWRYPLVEAFTAFLSLCVALHFGFSTTGIAALFLVWFLVALSFIDLDCQLLPDSLTLPLLWLGFLVNLCPNGFVPIQSAVIGAMAGYLCLWSIYWAFKLLTKKEGMGYGDFKLLAALGAWFGWKMILPIVCFASFVGAVVGCVLIVAAKRGKNIPIPFGPYLAGGGLLALFLGQSLLTLFFPTL